MSPGVDSEGRRAHLESLRADADIRAWIKDHRSPHTAEIQLVQLELFCRKNGVEPSELVALGRAQLASSDVRDRKLSHLVQAWVDSERESGRPDSYIATNWAALRSWLKFSEAAPQWAPKLRVRRGTTLENESTPSPKELGRILSVLSARDRMIALMIAHSGLRPGVLGSRFEMNGLRLRDLPDLRLRPIEFSNVPFLVVVPAELSKIGTDYVTFGSTEAAESVTAHLSERRRRGEFLAPESPLVRSEPKTSTPNRREFLSEKSIATQLRKGMEKVVAKGHRWRAMVLRSYFSTQMESAERAGKTTRTFREALMGHTTPIEFGYHLGKKLRPDKIEEMRAAYKRCEPFLSTSQVHSDVDEAQRNVASAVLAALGISPKDSELALDGTLTADQIRALVERSHATSAIRRRTGFAGEDAKSHTLAGWSIVTKFEDGTYILEPPPTTTAYHAGSAPTFQ